MPPKGNVQVKEKKEFTLAEALAKVEAQGTFQDDTLNFYSTFELPYGVFSNFWPAAIVINNITFKTSEHYFQALKFEPTDPASFKAVIDADNCMEVTKIGRDRSRILRPDWESVKMDVMFDALTAKYLTHEELFKILLSTGSAMIWEHTTIDKFWGDGGDYLGGNHLGKQLVQLREAVKGLNAQQRAVIVKTLAETGKNMLRLQQQQQQQNQGAVATADKKQEEEKFQ